MTSVRVRFLWTAIALAVGLVASSDVVAQRGDPQRGGQRGDLAGTVGITIYAEPDFRGTNATFRNDVPDLRKFNMNDRVDSLQIARGEAWEVCENINYKGRCRVFSADESDLGRISWGGLVSSFRRLRDAGGRGFGRESFPSLPPMAPRLVLFDDSGFRGRAFVVTAANPTLRALGNRARSAKAYGSAWELCDGDRFRGHCEIISGNVADLGRLSLRDKVSSARPVGRGR